MGPSGSVTGCVGIHRHRDPRPWTDDDVTQLRIVGNAITGVLERGRVEAARRESEERLRGVIDNTQAGYFRIDRAGRYQRVNLAWLRMHGYDSADEVLGRHYSVTQVETDVQAAQQVVETLLAGGSFPAGEFSRRRRDGSTGFHTLSAHPVIREGGIVGLEGFMIDTTDQKRAEEEKAKLEAQLQQAQKMESVGRRAGGVAHDFNNMLGVILGHVDMAIEQVDPAQPLHDDLMEIREAASRSADLTRQLLAFARKQTVAPKVLDLNETVAGMLKMLERLIGEDIQLSLQPGADLWPVSVDPSQIDQILANLCVNARDAIADVGRITIETGNCTLDEAYCADHPGSVPGECVRIAVSDDGCGMDRETLSHLFEPFFTTKVVGKGTGLGLATVYGSVKQNGGFIAASSELGRGTTFTIWLPRHAVKAGRARTEAAAGPATLGHETILLVEDEPDILRLTARILERQGYTVLAAPTPGEAIRLAKEHAGVIPLLVTDVVMPEMNGRDLATNLMALYPGLKRLFMSGYTADVIAHHGVLDEGVHFIQKPFSAEGLAAKVREALGGE
jgi:PAS domain S-box-containing protein